MRLHLQRMPNLRKRMTDKRRLEPTLIKESVKGLREREIDKRQERNYLTIRVFLLGAD